MKIKAEMFLLTSVWYFATAAVTDVTDISSVSMLFYL